MDLGCLERLIYYFNAKAGLSRTDGLEKESSEYEDKKIM